MQQVSDRYNLLEHLGKGGMGSVYRAYDRLNKQIVALKQVLDFAAEEGSRPSDGTANSRVVLAHEFQVLASLRHPHIIEVLDYGFDKQKQPFYTMSLLTGGTPLTKYAAGKDTPAKVRLLIQALQALAYLHRRGITHRDLKPDNALVTSEGDVKILDFGLATRRDSGDMAEELAGTIAYMGPELLQGGAADVRSDLYAVGIMAYEIFAGEHPFNTSNPGLLIQDILFAVPDLTIVSDNEQIVEVIEKLMRKDPEDRYADAYDVIKDLANAIDQPMPEETTAIRESFLQAAQFVGREKEQAALVDALRAAINGEGSLWLVGGESGVGKSRLVEELKTQAMVRGALVVHGEGVAEGGVTYQLWREAVRRLLLSVPVDDTKAGILKQIVPDISELLGREIPDIAELEGQIGQRRLLDAIAGLFKSHDQPIVLLMEDLQWAEESLDVLEHIMSMVKETSLLILGNYRDDEAPDLPERFPESQHIKLDRLDADGIQKLSVSMLGEAGNRAEIVDFLKNETEGNVFFLVEVVRALAEDAGRLSNIGMKTLPAQVFAGGMHQVIQRRLAQVPAFARSLLELAAVAGRYLDLKLLQAVDPDFDMNNWLTQCANVAVIDVVEERWRFAHDKLREGLLKDMSAAGRYSELNIQVAELLQTVYADHVDDYAALVSDHYERAEETLLAANWHSRAGNHARRSHAPQLAIKHYERALSLWMHYGDALKKSHGIPRKDIYLGLGQVLITQMQHEEAVNLLKELLELPDVQDDVEARAQAHYHIADSMVYQGKIEEALKNIESGEKLMRDSGIHSELFVRILTTKGWALLRTGNMQDALANGEESLQLAQKIEGTSASFLAYSLLGPLHAMTGQFAKAVVDFEQAIAIMKDSGDEYNVHSALNNLGFLLKLMGDYEGALSRFHEAIRITREMGFRTAELVYQGNVGGALVALGRYNEAETELDEMLAAVANSGMYQLPEYMLYLAEAQLGQYKFHESHATAMKSFEMAYESKNPEYVVAAWRVVGRIAAAYDAPLRIMLDGEEREMAAGECFSESARISEEQGIQHELAQTLRHWAYYEASMGNPDAAQEKWKAARTIFKSIGADQEYARMPKTLEVQ